MFKKATLYISLFSALAGAYAQEEDAFEVMNSEFDDAEVLLIKDEKKRLSLSRKDELPSNRDKNGDRYMEGYVQALIDANYYEYNVLVYVKDKVVYLYNLPKNDLISNSIVAFVKDIPSVDQVELGKEFPSEELQIQEEYIGRSTIKGIWFPQSTLVYQPMVADPRNPGNSVGYRWGDQVIGDQVVEVSLGDVFPIFRWREVFPAKGDLQFDIVGCAWSLFKMWPDNAPDNEWAELVNTDYLLALPLSYAFDKWSFRLQAYHISTHLGDEFLAKRPFYVRKNPSMEALDFFTAYQFTENLRAYVGLGWIFHSDQSFPMKPFYVEYGGEARFFGTRSYYHMLYGTPFLAVFMRNWQENDWKLDATVALGYEWSKLQGVGRKVRIFGEYRRAYSDGEFFNKIADFFEIRVYYGY
jgi:hypothetical protein